MCSENNLWVCRMFSDVFRQISGTISKRINLGNVLFILTDSPNLESRHVNHVCPGFIMLHSVSCLLTIWFPASYNTTSVSYSWAVSRILTESTQHRFPMVSIGTLNLASKCFVKLICLLRTSYFLYFSMQEVVARNSIPNFCWLRNFVFYVGQLPCKQMSPNYATSIKTPYSIAY